ncbi:hypothetical protein Bca4012_033293 [Brassica carinata]
MKINILVIVAFSFLIAARSLPVKQTLNYESIFNFGDSLSDTGNFLISSDVNSPSIGRPPYGQTFFNRSTGRCSDGRLIIDFIDCDQYFKKSLFFVGEIGGNDYNYPLLAFRSYKHAIDLVPSVINKIINVTSALIEEGAVTLVVPGNLPIGCSAVLLERFSDDNRWLYDTRNHCLKPLNNIAKLHNAKLQEGLATLRQKYTHAKIIYADYYGSAMQFFNSPSKYGFTGSVLKACCGGEDGRYNAKPNVKCGGQGSTTCENPSTYANWDGIHLTEAAYRHIATGLISGRFTKPSLSNSSSFSKF